MRLRVVRDGSHIGISLNQSVAVNGGTIIAHSVGVELKSASYLLNSGTIDGGSLGAWLFSGTIANSGLIEGALTQSAGVYLAGTYATGGVLINSGTIEGTGSNQSYGVYVNSANVDILNKRGALISGLTTGIEFYKYGSGTVTNAGTIIGSSGTAVQFNAGNDRLILAPGSSIVGKVDGGAGNNVLELSAGIGVGTLAGFGTNVTNFQALTVDYGAVWSLSGTNVLSGVTIADSGTLMLAGTTALDVPITGWGEVVLDGIDRFNAGGVVQTASLALAAGVSTITADLDYQGAFASTGGTLALAGHDFTLLGSAQLGGGAITGGTLVTEGIAGLSALSLIGTWQDYGNIVQSGRLVLGAATGARGRLDIETDSTLTLTGNAVVASGTVGAGSISNTGFLQKTGGGLSVIGSNLTSQTNIVANIGTLELTGTDTLSGIIGGNGTLEMGGGRDIMLAPTTLRISHWAVTGGFADVRVNLSYAGGFSETNGTVAMTTGGTLNLTGGVSLAGGAFAGEITSVGGLLQTFGAVSLTRFTVDGAGNWRDFGTVSAPGTLFLGSSVGGSGRFVIAAGGLFNLTGAGGIMLTSGGTGSFQNSGLLEKTAGAGTSVIGLATTNSATISAAAGTLDFTGGVTGTGSATIGSAGTLEFSGAVSATQTIHFAGTAGGMLKLNDPSGNTLSFAGAVSGFSGADAIDLTTFAFSGTPKTAWTQSGTKGTLTITDGAKTAHVVLFGQYVAAGFHLVKDAGTGTVVTYTPPTQTALASPHH